MSELILINITGKDRTGLVARFTGVLGDHGVNVLDIGQAVIHDYISLGILAEIPDAQAVVARDQGPALCRPRPGRGYSLPPHLAGRVRSLGARAGQGAAHHHGAWGASSPRAQIARVAAVAAEQRAQHRRDHAALGPRLAARPGRASQGVCPVDRQRPADRRAPHARPALADLRRHGHRHLLPCRRHLPAQPAAGGLRHGLDPDPVRGDRRTGRSCTAWAPRSLPSPQPPCTANSTFAESLVRRVALLAGLDEAGAGGDRRRPAAERRRRTRDQHAQTARLQAGDPLGRLRLLRAPPAAAAGHRLRLCQPAGDRRRQADRASCWAISSTARARPSCWP